MSKINQEQVAEVIAASDIGIVPIQKDTFTDLMLPNKIFEFTAMKKPIIASGLKAMREYFEKDSVLFFESGNEEGLARKILYLYQSPRKRKDLVKNLEAFAQKYNWEKEKQKYFAIINNLINDSNCYKQCPLTG